MNIRDIAGRCHVSVATVSRVINESPNVSAKTREKVLAIMREEGYTPNAFARGLGLNSMRMVGILCTDVANPFYALAVSLLERDLRDKGFNTLLCCSGTALDKKKRCLSLLLEKRVDAIMLVGAAFYEKKDNKHIAEAARQVPVFLINAHLSLPNVYWVLCDEREAMRSSVGRMAAAGYDRILYLHDMLRWAWAGTRKMEGFRQGLEDEGIPQDSVLIQGCERGVLPAQQAIAALLDQGIAFSGIIASEDILAVGAQKALLERGLSLPIIGFNNSIFCACTTPTLTSVDNMLGSLCPTAVEMLDRLLAGGQVPENIVVSATLIERETFPLRTANAH